VGVVFYLVVGAFAMSIIMFLLAKYFPAKNDRHLKIMEEQLRVFNERMVEERRLADALEKIVAQFTPTNRLKEAIACVRGASRKYQSKEDFDLIDIALSLLAQQASV
jgi:hypothetical protein